MNASVLDNKLAQAARYGSIIKADATTEPPTRIEVMRAGSWPETSNKGALTISLEDLDEFVQNFHNGVGVPGGKEAKELPIDFSHNDHMEAAGWITDLVSENGVLYADVEWSDSGAAALKGKRFKCFSPSFWPGCLGEYHDAEDYSVTARNVLVGGGLTNIPFFKDLTAIMASNAGNSKDSNKNVNAPKENTVPTLDEVRIKDVASLTADDKQVLADNKTSLSEAELEKFGMADKKVEAAAVTGISDEDKAILASVKDGSMKVVKAADYDDMKAKVDASTKQLSEMREVQVKAAVTEHLKRGAIKTDQVDEWTKRIVADATMEDVLKALPDNKQMASVSGSSSGESAVTAADEVRTKAAELVKAAKEDGRTMPMYEAQSQVMASDGALAKRFEDEMKGVN